MGLSGLLGSSVSLWGWAQGERLLPAGVRWLHLPLQTLWSPVHHLLLQGQLRASLPAGAGLHLCAQATRAHPL